MKMSRLLLAFVFVITVCASSWAFPVTIDPVAYNGRYFLSGSGELSGKTTVDLSPGTYTIDNGTSVGGSAFGFTVDVSGNVSTSGPSAVATGSILRFNNATIIINPVQYTGRYFLSSHGTTKTFSGFASEVVIPGLVYAVDTGANVGTAFGFSSFAFAVDGSGLVTTSSPAATGSGGMLQFNNVSITVNPATYTGRYYLSSHAINYNYFVGPQTIVELPGLVYYVDNGSFTANSDFLFSLTNSGQIANITDPTAAVATGSTLTFTPIAVGVSPGTYTGTYTVGGYAGLSGFKTLALLPNLVTSVSVPFQGQAGTIMPTSTGVTPSTLTFVVSGQTYVFTFAHSAQDVLNLLASEVQTFLISGGISPAAAATVASAIQGAGPFLTSNPAQAKIILNNLITAINTLTAMGQINPAVQNTLVPQINLLIALLP